MSISRFVSLASVVSGLFAIGACSSEEEDGPTGPGTGPIPPPAASYVYQATIRLDSIRISTTEACDGRDLFGRGVPGAFHYKVSANVGTTVSGVASDGYGSLLGVALSRGPKGIIALGGRTLTFRDLEAADNLILKFSMIEWDGPFMDGVLKGQVESFGLNAGTLGSDYANPAALAVGHPATCGGTLFFNVRVVGTVQ